MGGEKCIMPHIVLWQYFTLMFVSLIILILLYISRYNRISFRSNTYRYRVLLFFSASLWCVCVYWPRISLDSNHLWSSVLSTEAIFRDSFILNKRHFWGHFIQCCLSNENPFHYHQSRSDNARMIVRPFACIVGRLCISFR